MATIATLYKSGEVEGNSAYTHHPGGMFVRKTVYTSPAFAVNDVVQLVDVFAGECLHAVILETTDIDTNGSPAIVLDLGYGNSDTETVSTSDDIIDGSTIGQAGGIALDGSKRILLDCTHTSTTGTAKTALRHNVGQRQRTR